VSGWVKLYRNIIEDELWKISLPKQKVIMLHLILMVNHKESTWAWQGEKFNVPAGGMVTSLESIKRFCGRGISIRNVRTALVSFSRYGFLTNKSTKTGRLIQIANYEKYQKYDNVPDKQVTKTRQTGDKEVTPNKKYKNNKNDKNKNIYSRIFNYWNSQKIIVHKQLDDKTIRKINGKLNAGYKEDEIKEAIRTYKIILHDDDFWYEYSWTLDKFLERGFELFKDRKAATKNYIKKEKEDMFKKGK